MKYCLRLGNKAKNIIKSPNPNYFIQTSRLMSSRHSQTAAVKLGSATSSTRQLPTAVGMPEEQRGQGLGSNKGWVPDT